MFCEEGIAERVEGLKLKLHELNREQSMLQKQCDEICLQQLWISYFYNKDDIIDVQGKLNQKSVELDNKLGDIHFKLHCLKNLLCDINKFEKQHVISIISIVEKQVNKSALER